VKLLVIALLCACTVNRKSDTIKCDTTADCTESDHVCQNGYCVKSSDSGCPDHCSACDTTVTPHTCMVTGTGGDSFDCPSGYVCTLNCGGGSNSACGDITCDGNSQCVISCEGDGNCGDVTCSSACACDVTCTSNGCQNNTIQCPHTGNKYCTPDQTDGPACTSASGGRCNSC
jgi:hypothetical protein